MKDYKNFSSSSSSSSSSSDGKQFIQMAKFRRNDGGGNQQRQQSVRTSGNHRHSLPSAIEDSSDAKTPTASMMDGPMRKPSVNLLQTREPGTEPSLLPLSARQTAGHLSVAGSCQTNGQILPAYGDTDLMRACSRNGRTDPIAVGQIISILTDAQNKYISQNFSLALQGFSQILLNCGIFPDKPIPPPREKNSFVAIQFYNRAQCSLAMRKYDCAISNARKALQFDQRIFRAHLILARSYRAYHDHHLAEIEYRIVTGQVMSVQVQQELTELRHEAFVSRGIPHHVAKLAAVHFETIDQGIQVLTMRGSHDWFTRVTSPVDGIIFSDVGREITELNSYRRLFEQQCGFSPLLYGGDLSVSGATEFTSAADEYPKLAETATPESIKMSELSISSSSATPKQTCHSSSSSSLNTKDHPRSETKIPEPEDCQEDWDVSSETSGFTDARSTATLSFCSADGVASDQTLKDTTFQPLKDTQREKKLKNLAGFTSVQMENVPAEVTRDLLLKKVTEILGHEASSTVTLTEITHRNLRRIKVVDPESAAQLVVYFREKSLGEIWPEIDAVKRTREDIGIFLRPSSDEREKLTDDHYPAKYMLGSDECFKWRTSGCELGVHCPHRHVPIARQVDLITPRKKLS